MKEILKLKNLVAKVAHKVNQMMEVDQIAVISRVVNLIVVIQNKAVQVQTVTTRVTRRKRKREFSTQSTLILMSKDLQRSSIGQIH